jgi:hypothetical protein
MIHIKILSYGTGQVLKAFLRRVSDNTIYSTDADDFVTENAADIADYILDTTEDAIAKQTYNFILDQDIPVGDYTLEVYVQAGGTLDTETDTRLAVSPFQYQNAGVYRGYVVLADPQVAFSTALGGSSSSTSIDNIEVALADTEYSVSISNAKSVKINFQDGEIGENWRWALESGKVDTLTHDYILYDQGVQEEWVDFSGTIYLASSTTGYFQVIIRS